VATDSGRLRRAVTPLPQTAMLAANTVGKGTPSITVSTPVIATNKA